MGDGSALYGIHAPWAAANRGDLGDFRRAQQWRMRDSEVFLTASVRYTFQGLDLPRINFAALVSGRGANYRRMPTPENGLKFSGAWNYPAGAKGNTISVFTELAMKHCSCAE